MRLDCNETRSIDRKPVEMNAAVFFGPILVHVLVGKCRSILPKSFHIILVSDSHTWDQGSRVVFCNRIISAIDVCQDIGVHSVYEILS